MIGIQDILLELNYGLGSDWVYFVIAPNYLPVESLQSHMIFTMSHWSSGLTCLLPATRVTGSNPQGGLKWDRDFPVSVVSLHWWPRRDWSSTGLCPQQLSLGPHANNVTVLLDLTQLSCPGFMLAAGLPSGFTTDAAAGGEPSGEPAISHDSHHVSLVQWTNLFASRHKCHRFKSPGGT